jgi:hypothetical protein
MTVYRLEQDVHGSSRESGSWHHGVHGSGRESGSWHQLTELLGDVFGQSLEQPRLRGDLDEWLDLSVCEVRRGEER